MSTDTLMTDFPLVPSDDIHRLTDADRKLAENAVERIEAKAALGLEVNLEFLNLKAADDRTSVKDRLAIAEFQRSCTSLARKQREHTSDQPTAPPIIINLPGAPPVVAYAPPQGALIEGEAVEPAPVPEAAAPAKPAEPRGVRAESLSDLDEIARSLVGGYRLEGA